MRRTQAERREQTRGRLLDASVEALVEVGYARSTVKAICERAGVSQGGLFRHFPSREALMVAVGEHVGAAVLADFRQELSQSPPGADRLEIAIAAVRSRTRSSVNIAWYELVMAARTNAALREAFQPVADRYFDQIEALGRELLPELALAAGADFRLLVETIVAVFDGASMHRFVLSDRSDREGQPALIASLMKAWMARPRSTGSGPRSGS